MIRFYANENGKLTELDEPRPACWINITPPFNHAELEKLANQMDIPLDFLTDSLDIDERSRYEREEQVRLIV
ncbi:MAG: magnesium transporter CorA family protein, partial [Bacteroidota bacterium]